MDNKHATDLATVLSKLVAFRTEPDGGDHALAAEWIGSFLREGGFTVRLQGEGSTPLIEAYRAPAEGARGHVLFYGHYDVDEVVEGWRTEPFCLEERHGRWHGLGVGDNKGALAARLVALRRAEKSPAVTMWLQGEEETGSEGLRAWLRDTPLPEADWYLDENGWRDPGGVERVLACTVTDETPGPLSGSAADALLEVMSPGAPVRLEARYLNKIFVPGGCAFQGALRPGCRYLAIGTNDSGTRIHAPNESIAVTNAVHHQAAIERLLGHVSLGRLG